MSQVTLAKFPERADSNLEIPLVVIDSQVTQLPSLIKDLQSRAQVVILDNQRDGIEQITQVLNQYQHLSSLHVVAHGSPGSLYLGNSRLNLANFHHYQQQLASWEDSLAGKDILIYGCQVAQGAGQLFLEQLARITGSNIAASRNTVGLTESGNRYWQLEFQIGTVHTGEVIFSQSFQDSYQGAFIDFDEAADGDISNDPDDPLELTLEVGSNTISATTGPAAADQEFVTVTVPEGLQLDELILESFSPTGDDAFIGVQEGDIFTEPLDNSADTANILGFALFGGSAGDIGSDILDNIGNGAGTIGFAGSLPSGDYTFALQQLSPPSTYTLDFNVSEVAPEPTPEPAPAPEIEPDLIEVTVTVENLAPEGGTFQTPVWVGFHNGEFDTFSLGEAATPGLESLAEDGSVALISEEFLASGFGLVDGAIAGTDGLAGPIDPGEVTSLTFTIDANADTSQFFSFASMVIPSNDAFIGDDEPISLFDADGNFVGVDFIVTGSEVYDAGTEVNDELEATTAFFSQAEPNTGSDENGVVTLHPGFIEGGRILTEDGTTEGAPGAFTNADFTAEGYEALRITISEVAPAPDTVPDDGDDDSDIAFEPVFGTVEGDILEVEGSGQLIFAGDFDDLIDASTGDGDNRIYGGNGDDVVILGTGDRILAGEGDDSLFATSGGDNTITGGAGADQFWIATAEIPAATNVVTDFTSGEDVIGLAGLGIGFADVSITDLDGNALIAASGSDLAILEGIAADSLIESDFAFG
ncbi:MAG: DUF4347 domain-containing protein [Cyanobacteria bacterium J06621_8]